MALLSSRFFYINNEDIGVLQPPSPFSLLVLIHKRIKGEGFGLFPFRSSLLRESLLIFLFRLLRYFSSPTYLSKLNGFGLRVTVKNGWVSPFGDPRIKACLLAPRGLSQASASFIGNISQGIRYTLIK